MCVPISVTAQHVRCPRGVSHLHTPGIHTPDPAHVVDWGQIEVDTDGTFEEGPWCIICSRDQVLRHKDREASEGAMAALWSGGVNVGARGHDAGYLSLLCLGMKVRGLVV